jgi:hypothetical protein
MIGAVGMPVTTIVGKVDIGSAGISSNANVANAAIGGNFLFANGDGDSYVLLGQSGGRVTIGGLVRVTTAVGNASVQAFDLGVASDFVVSYGDSTSNSSVDLNGSGTVSIGRDLTISFGNGYSLAVLANVAVARNLKITSLSGTDVVLIEGTSVGGNTTIDTGSGDDALYIGVSQTTDLSHGSVSVKTGSGNDSVIVGEFTALRFTPTPNFLFDGGDDSDTIDLYFAVTGALVNKVKNFETIS